MVLVGGTGGWETVPDTGFGSDLPIHQGLTAVHGDGSGSFWAGGNYDILAHGDTSDWAVEPELPAGLTGIHLVREIWVAAPDLVYATVVSDTPGAEVNTPSLIRFDGSVWSVVEEVPDWFGRGSASHCVGAVHGRGEDDVYVSGGRWDDEAEYSSMVEVILLHFDGTTWEEVPIAELNPTETPFNCISDLWAAPDGTLFGATSRSTFFRLIPCEGE
jgi:hypothetical protein